MKEYVMALIGASLVSGALLMLSPTGHKKYLRLLCGLCTVALLAAPLPSYLSELKISLPTYGDEATVGYEEAFRQTLCTASGAQIEEALKSLLVSELSLSEKEVFVAVIWEEGSDTLMLKKAIISLSGSAVLSDPRPLRERAEALLGCPCEIVYI